jgi:guanosine-diphosphatase
MTQAPSTHSFTDPSKPDTQPSTSSSTTTSTRSSSPSPPPSSNYRVKTSSLADTLPLRRRLTASRRIPKSQRIQSPKQPDMFSSRKYTPLPTSANGQARRRAGGGMPAWKRYGLMGTFALVTVVLIYGFSGSKSSGEVWDAESESSNFSMC